MNHQNRYYISPALNDFNEHLDEELLNQSSPSNISPNMDERAISDTDSYGDTSALEDDEYNAVNGLQLSSPSQNPAINCSNCYAYSLSKIPFVIAIVTLLLGGLTGLTFKFEQLPDFDDPTAGFEARGTYISAGIKTLNNVFYHSSGVFTAVPDPNLINIPGINISQFLPNNRREEEKPDSDSSSKDNASNADRSKRSLEDLDFCSSDYLYQDNLALTSRIKVIFESSHGENLWSVEGLRAICEMEDKIISKSLDYPKCRQMSIANSIASLRDTCCTQLTQPDLDWAQQLLLECYPFYESGALTDKCGRYAGNDCANVPDNCTRRNVVFNILYYMADTNFITNNSMKTNETFLTYTMMIYHLSNYINAAKYYTEYFNGKETDNGVVKITGFFRAEDDKYNLFSDYLISDIIYFGLAAGLILLILMLYLRSIVLVVATLINIMLSFSTAYFLYNVVLQIKFFPFMNMLAGLILIAVGADDVFIFYDTWQQVKSKRKEYSFMQQIQETLRHAALSIFVTSFTTSAAFFANNVSHITAIRCFGIFAGLAVISNFFFMITWTPGVIFTIELLYQCLSRPGRAKPMKKCLTLWKTFTQGFKAGLHQVFGIALPKFIKSLWHVSILLLLGVGVAGSVCVFHWPGLKLPHSDTFQLLPSSNAMEKWDSSLKDKFQNMIDSEASTADNMAVYFVWGLHAEDNGDQFDPNDDGKLHFDSDFDITDPEAQVFLRNFCQELKKQNFTDNETGSKNCFFDTAEYLLKQQCGMLELMAGQEIICCEGNKTLPLEASVMKTCLPALTLVVGKFDSTSDHIFYDKQNKAIAYEIQVIIKSHFSSSYEKMQALFNSMNTFMDKQLAKAPKTSKYGFFSMHRYFELFALQNAIISGTYSSIALSLGVAAIVMLATSLNILITIYALATISLAILATVGSLVLMGWELNILESVTISLAVGLSIDFTIHYGVAYRLSHAKSRQGRVIESFERVGSAVAMAALTTFIAGSAVMPSHVVAYQELGTFLMIVMALSWVYATFFFQSICYVIGPEGNICQIPIPKMSCCSIGDSNSHQLSVRSEPSLVFDIDDDDPLLNTF